MFGMKATFQSGKALGAVKVVIDMLYNYIRSSKFITQEFNATVDT